MAAAGVHDGDANDLAIRLAALDPEVGAALRAAGHFDALLAAHAGLQDVVGGGAELAGCAARYVDRDRGLVVRALPDGALEAGAVATDPTWLLTTLDAVARTGSQRDAARALHLHHSTLRDPAGRLRLQLALHLRRAARSSGGRR